MYYIPLNYNYPDVPEIRQVLRYLHVSCMEVQQVIKLFWERLLYHFLKGYAKMFDSECQFQKVSPTFLDKL